MPVFVTRTHSIRTAAGRCDAQQTALRAPTPRSSPQPVWTARRGLGVLPRPAAAPSVPPVRGARRPRRPAPRPAQVCPLERQCSAASHVGTNFASLPRIVNTVNGQRASAATTTPTLAPTPLAHALVPLAQPSLVHTLPSLADHVPHNLVCVLFSAAECAAGTYSTGGAAACTSMCDSCDHQNLLPSTR